MSLRKLQVPLKLQIFANFIHSDICYLNQRLLRKLISAAGVSQQFMWKIALITFILKHFVSEGIFWKYFYRQAKGEIQKAFL